MARAEHFVLQCLLLIYILYNVNGEYHRGDVVAIDLNKLENNDLFTTLDVTFISYLVESEKQCTHEWQHCKNRSYLPVVNTERQRRLSRCLKRFRNPIIAIIHMDSTDKTPLRTDDVRNKDVEGKKALRYMNDIIQSTGDDNIPNVKRSNDKFGKALRSRCEKFIECKIKCRKKKDPCENVCQSKYDDLNVCETTKDKWLTKTNRQVYEYLKKNPPQYIKSISTKGPKWADSDECKFSDECKSKNECESSEECKIEIPIKCEPYDSCN